MVVGILAQITKFALTFSSQSLQVKENNTVAVLYESPLGRVGRGSLGVQNGND
jgi:hypothetical protein